MGHANIVSVDVDPAKRAGALAAGARIAVDGAGEGVAQRILEACGGPVLAVIDLVNGTATARAAFDALRKGGTLVQVGLFGGELTVPLPIMAFRALTVRGSYVGTPADLREMMALAASGRLDPIPVETVPMEQADAALARLRAGQVRGRLVLRAEAA
jgi:alcohol dehydrogenase/propanol-preferring alcohol dehydrogenase